MTTITTARRLLGAARRLVVLSGAGMSAESGIPTFRDNAGLWTRFPIRDFGHIRGLSAMWHTDARRVIDFFVHSLDCFIRAEPNAGHQALADLQTDRRQVVVITQNIDDLHERAGSTTVLKLHGDLFALRCLECSLQQPWSREQLSAAVGQLRALVKASAGRGVAHELLELAPRCTECAALSRPDVVLFEESLSQDVWQAAQQSVAQADCLLVVGTSVSVVPAANIPGMAHRKGIPIVEINPQPAVSQARVTLSQAAAAVLPHLLPGN